VSPDRSHQPRRRFGRPARRSFIRLGQIITVGPDAGARAPAENAAGPDVNAPPASRPPRARSRRAESDPRSEQPATDASERRFPRLVRRAAVRRPCTPREPRSPSSARGAVYEAAGWLEGSGAPARKRLRDKRSLVGGSGGSPPGQILRASGEGAAGPRSWSDAGWLRGQTTRRRIHRRSDGGPERRQLVPQRGTRAPVSMLHRTDS